MAIDCKDLMKAKLEAEIDGKRVFYDAIGSTTLEAAKSFYEPRYKYIGTTTKIWVNDVLQTIKGELTKEYHIFIFN